VAELGYAIRSEVAVHHDVCGRSDIRPAEVLRLREGAGVAILGTEAELYYVYPVRGEEICRMEFHPSREAARAAAGIED
jgi:hypothetical protein